MELLVLLHRPAHLIFDVKCDLGITVLVQHDKSAVAINHRFRLDLWTALQYLFQSVIHRIGHRQITASAACLGFLNVVFTTTLTNQLMIYSDSAILEVQILSGQTAELADSHAGFQKHYKLIVVFGVGFVALDEIHPDRQLFLGECGPRHRIVHHHIRQLKYEWIFPDRILIASHLKCGLNDTSHTGDGTVTSAILLQFGEPLFGIGYLNGADFAMAEILFLDQIQNKVVTDLCVVAHAFLQADVLLQQFDYRSKVGNLVKIRDVYLTVVNSDDVMAIKALMSGLVSQVPVEGIGNMNFTSLMEVMFKGSAYVLCGELPHRFGLNEHMMLKIPMSAENEMESQYSISDIEIGKVTVLGIYRGEFERCDVERKINRMMALNNSSKKSQEQSNNIQDSSMDIEDGVREEDKKDIPNASVIQGKVHYIDVIAIIQDLNV